jgi:hypothetical protein
VGRAVERRAPEQHRPRRPDGLDARRCSLAEDDHRPRSERLVIAEIEPSTT